MIKLIKSLSWVFNHPNNRNNFLKTLFRVVWWKLNQFLFKYPVIVDLKKDAKYVAYPESSFGGLVIYTKLPEYYEMNYFTKLIEPNDTVIDVGAHMGDYTVLAGSKIKTGKIIAFEPSESALKVLNENIAINNLQARAIVYPCLVSDKNGYSLYHEGKTSETGHIVTKKNKNSNKIQSVTIDSILKKKNIKNIKIVKIDVEGASMLVLKGMKLNLKKNLFKNMIVEINKDSLVFGTEPQEILDYIKSFGYKTYCFNSQGVLEKLDIYPHSKKYINVIAKI